MSKKRTKSKKADFYNGENMFDSWGGKSVATPNLLARSELFIQHKGNSKRAVLDGKELFCENINKMKIRMFYSGIELGHDDLRLWQELVNLYQGKDVYLNSIINFSAHSILMACNKTGSKSNYIWLNKSIKRLASSLIVIKEYDKKEDKLINEIFFHLINKGWRSDINKKYSIKIDPDVLQVLKKFNYSRMFYSNLNKLHKNDSTTRHLLLILSTHSSEIEKERGLTHLAEQFSIDVNNSKEKSRFIREQLPKSCERLIEIDAIEYANIDQKNDKFRWKNVEYINEDEYVSSRSDSDQQQLNKLNENIIEANSEAKENKIKKVSSCQQQNNLSENERLSLIVFGKKYGEEKPDWLNLEIWNIWIEHLTQKKGLLTENHLLEQIGLMQECIEGEGQDFEKVVRFSMSENWSRPGYAFNGSTENSDSAYSIGNSKQVNGNKMIEDLDNENLQAWGYKMLDWMVSNNGKKEECNKYIASLLSKEEGAVMEAWIAVKADTPVKLKNPIGYFATILKERRATYRINY